MPLDLPPLVTPGGLSQASLNSPWPTMPTSLPSPIRAHAGTLPPTRSLASQPAQAPTL
ncbi:hypothetical protein N431DRAFT_142114 [Stipitochalara longipes BDJ]|nr:hypothetical protein N431DRAFT_142114 [Stipitochalara longipes BDJ]